MEDSDGRVVKVTGDGLMAIFSSAHDSVRACLEAQRRLQAEAWGETGPLRVRMGLHAGQAQPRGGDFYGPAVNRAARIMAAGQGGQVLLSSVVAELTSERLPKALMDLAKVLRRAGRAGEVIIAVRQALQLYEQKGNAVAARGARELQMELASPAFLS